MRLELGSRFFSSFQIATTRSIPDELRRIVAKCLEKKTDKPTPSATALLHDVKAFERGIESSAVIENWVDSLQNIATEAAVSDHDRKGPNDWMERKLACT